jgi:hypothetical protein
MSDSWSHVRSFTIRGIRDVLVYHQFTDDRGWAIHVDGESGCNDRHGFTREEAAAEARRLAGVSENENPV